MPKEGQLKKVGWNKRHLTFPMEIHDVSHKRTFNFLLEGIRTNRMIVAGDFLLLPLYMLCGL